MSHSDAYIRVAQDIYWFVRWPLMCFFWMMAGNELSEHKIQQWMSLALVWTLIVTNCPVTI